jgi:hypothetical protein
MCGTGGAGRRAGTAEVGRPIHIVLPTTGETASTVV